VAPAPLEQVDRSRRSAVASSRRRCRSARSSPRRTHDRDRHEPAGAEQQRRMRRRARSVCAPRARRLGREPTKQVASARFGVTPAYLPVAETADQESRKARSRRRRTTAGMKVVHTSRGCGTRSQHDADFAAVHHDITASRISPADLRPARVPSHGADERKLVASVGVGSYATAWPRPAPMRFRSADTTAVHGASPRASIQARRDAVGDRAVEAHTR